MKRVCLFLDDETIVHLDVLKYELKKSKSEIVRKLFHYFNKEELKKIIRDDTKE